MTSPRRLPVVAGGVLPIGDGDLRAPGFWTRLRALRTERLHRHPYGRAVLLGLAARADHCAERLTAALGELSSSAGTVTATADADATDRERIGADIDDLRSATERYLDDACAVARHHPWLSRLLLAIRDDKAEDLRELVQLRARLGLDDDGAAPVPAVVKPDLDPVIGRHDLDAAA